jgi:hypothetical protein
MPIINMKHVVVSIGKMINGHKLNGFIRPYPCILNEKIDDYEIANIDNIKF